MLPVRRGIVQLSMDGPNVNWSAFGQFSDEVETECDVELINIGSCGLHTIHNSYKAGMTASGFDVGSFLSALHWLFKDSPARREDFSTVTSSSRFPLSYCGHRWLENVPCMERALDILPHIRKYVAAIKKKALTEPGCKSFKVVLEALTDPLLEAKIEASLSIARILSPFLTKYQTDAPVLPFLASDLFAVVRRLLARYMKADVVATLVTPKDLLKLDLKSGANQVIQHKVDVGAAAKRLLRVESASERQQLELKGGTKAFLNATVTKIMDKSPIRYKLVRCAPFMNPRIMVSGEKATNLLSQVLDCLADRKYVKHADCDLVKSEFQDFILKLKECDSVQEFTDFDESVERLDSFLCKFGIVKDFPRLWNVFELLMVLSHGQAAVERGFSFNKEIAVENLQSHSVIAQRRILQYVKANGGAGEVVISKALLSAAASGRRNYQTYLDKEKESKRLQDKKRKADAEMEELNALKAKRKRLENETFELVKAADKLASEAETKQNFVLLAKSNAMREKSRKKKEEIESVEKDIQTNLQALSA